MNNYQLAQVAEKAYKRGDQYILGAFGNFSTSSFVNYKCKQYASNERNRKYIEVNPDRIAWDCYGLIKGAVWGNENGAGKYNPTQDRNDQGAWEASKEKGPLNNDSPIPRMVGLIVWKKGHVGIVVNVSAPDWKDWVVVDAYGQRDDLRRMTIREAGIWTHWFKDTFIEYSVEYVEPKKPEGEPGGGGGVGSEIHPYTARYKTSIDIQGYAEPKWAGGEKPILWKGNIFECDARLNEGEDYFARDKETGYWYLIHDKDRWYVTDALPEYPERLSGVHEWYRVCKRWDTSFAKREQIAATKRLSDAKRILTQNPGYILYSPKGDSIR